MRALAGRGRRPRSGRFRLIQPRGQFRKIHCAGKRRHGPVASDQLRPRQLAHPVAIDGEPDFLLEAVGERPLLGTGQAGLGERGTNSVGGLRSALPVDEDERRTRVPSKEFSPRGKFRKTRSAGKAPEVNDERLSFMRASQVLPAPLAKDFRRSPAGNGRVLLTPRASRPARKG